jgi:asparaginyl-tRNA synthetase
LTNGASVRLTGKLTESPGAGQKHELQVDAVDILGECDPEVSPLGFFLFFYFADMMLF